MSTSLEEEKSTLIKTLGYAPPLISVFVGIAVFFWGTYYPTFTGRLQWRGLKWAGFDALLFEGEADSPVYAFIEDGVELCGTDEGCSRKIGPVEWDDQRHYWGQFRRTSSSRC